LIRPGDRVDIVVAADIGRGVNQHREVQVLMQDVVVLATGVNVVNNIPRTVELLPGQDKAAFNVLTGDTKFSTITVEATPKEAQDLIYIMSTSPGNIYLTLRNPNDRNVTKFANSTVESVLGKPTALLDDSLRKPASAPAPLPVAPPPRPAPRKRGGGFINL
jgi:pilus assembly protein CpaB